VSHNPGPAFGLQYSVITALPTRPTPFGVVHLCRALSELIV
jgi:hypothetical protein